MKNYNEEILKKYKNKENFDIYNYKITNKLGQTIDLNGIISPLERDNRDLLPPIENQKDTPFCAAYSITTIFEALYWKKTGKLIQLDQDHVYAKAKELDGQLNCNGTTLEAAINACAILCGIDKNLKINVYTNDNTTNIINLIKYLVHKYDLVHVGMKIDTSWYNCDNENYIIKGNNEPLYGHAVVICGYDSTGIYICNSWGKSWGSLGTAICPWDVVLKELIYIATFEVAI